MRNFFIIVILALLSNSAAAQSGSKVQWTFSSKKIGANKYEVIMTANIQKTWHLYSQHQSEDAIALPTNFKFVKNPLVVLEGKVVEKGKLISAFDKATNSNSRYYADKVDFVQVVTVKAGVKTTVAGEVEFMVCDDKQCLPPDRVKFSVQL